MHYRRGPWFALIKSRWLKAPNHTPPIHTPHQHTYVSIRRLLSWPIPNLTIHNSRSMAAFFCGWSSSPRPARMPPRILGSVTGSAHRAPLVGRYLASTYRMLALWLHLAGGLLLLVRRGCHHGVSLFLHVGTDCGLLTSNIKTCPCYYPRNCHGHCT